MPLSDTVCRGAKPGEKPRNMADGDGLYLYVKPNGSRLWRMSYTFDKKRKVLSFGPYPTVGLGDARELRLHARKLLAQGVDPSTRRGRMRDAPVGNSFEEVARDWHAKQAKVLNAKHAQAVLSRLERDVFPAIGKRAIAAIEAPEILAALRKVEERGSMDVAYRLLQSVGAIFRFAIASGLATHDPAAQLRGALEPKPKTQHMARIPISELPEFLGRLSRYDGDAQTRIAILLTLHTTVRTNELRLARWSEIERDMWRIPAERMKMKREHLVPLSPTARKLFAQLRTIAGDSEWVVPGKKGKPISQNTMIFALYRLGYRSKLTIHGFRAMFSTL